MRVAFAHKPFLTEAVQFVAPSHRVQRAAHYMAAMGLWRPPCTQGIPGPLVSSSCNTCVAIRRYCLFVWATVVGIGVFVCIVHDRWIKLAERPHVVVGDSGQTDGEPCGDTWS